MRKMLLGLVACTLVLTSCSKKDDNNNGGSTTSTFTVGATSYTAGDVFTSGQQLVATTVGTVSGGVITFIFNGALPTANGTYKIAETIPSPGEVAIRFSGANPAAGYGSTGHDNVSAAVTVTGGKIKLDLPKTWATNRLGSTDSVQISAKIVQP